MRDLRLARLLGATGTTLAFVSCAVAFWYFSWSYDPDVTTATMLRLLGLLMAIGGATVAALGGWLVVVARAGRPAPLLDVLRPAGGRLLVGWLALAAVSTLPQLPLRALDVDPLWVDAVVVAQGAAVAALTAVIVFRVNRAQLAASSV
ncbi:hypothetical protein [Nonomuraea sp. NPDC048826]|uniref:hypothetical protein n=1 Tax=Nonomuraea sp. NPDC048826 TaxID=3364347 RepID=UPI003717BF50